LRIRRWGTASALALALLAGGPAAGEAERDPCEHSDRSKARRDLGPGHAPLVLGDSVAIYAVDPLARLGFEADARGCRLWPDGTDVLERRKERRRLPHLVVMALGSNWRIPMYEIERTVEVMGPGRVLAIVTPRGKNWERHQDVATVRRAARRWPEMVKVLDWVRASRGRRGWFGSDGIHLTRPGLDAYVRCIKQALPYAHAKPQAAAAGRGGRAGAARRHPCAPD
jgi:hypothetical protein